jgi:hypothetical protein
MTTSMQGPRQPRVIHRWDCTRRGPYTEQIVQLGNGHAQIVTRCEECNRTDTEPKDAA